MKAFDVSILSAEKPFYEGPCESVVLPTIDGSFGILADHCNMVAAVMPGILTCRLPGGEIRKAEVSHGLVKVEGNEVLLLVDTIKKLDKEN